MSKTFLIISAVIGLLVIVFKGLDELSVKDEKKTNYFFFLNRLHKYRNFTIPYFHKRVAFIILSFYRKIFNRLTNIKGIVRFSIFSCLLTFFSAFIGNIFQYLTPLGASGYYETPKRMLIIPLIFLVNIPFDFFTTLITKRHLFKVIRNPSYLNVLYRIFIDFILAFGLAFLCGISMTLVIHLNSNDLSFDILQNAIAEFFRHVFGVFGVGDNKFSYAYVFYIGTTLIPTMLYLSVLALLLHFRYVSKLSHNMYLRILENGTGDSYKDLKVFTLIAMYVITPIGAIVGIVIAIIK